MVGKIHIDDDSNVTHVTDTQRCGARVHGGAKRSHEGMKRYGSVSKPWYLVNPKIAGKWMFIPLKMYL